MAAAAHATLSSLFPGQKAFFDLQHAQAGLGDKGLSEGHDFGLLVAQRMLADRKDDPKADDDGYAFSTAYGAHRPDPDNPTQRAHGPFYGAKSKCFAVTDRHELDPPPAPATAAYIDALRQVRHLGIAPELTGTLPPGDRRTVDQTVTGLYWAYDGAFGLGTPPRLYNQIVRNIALARTPPNTTAEIARLFALVNAAMADAGILAWDQKYIHDRWRPVVGIREHDPSMGPTGTPTNPIDPDTDPGWLPLGAPKTNTTEKNFTPDFPAYPSGHATFGAAALHMTRLFYGIPPCDRAPDNLLEGLSFVSEELNGINKDNKGTVRPKHTRNFPGGLWRMIDENSRSRVYLGVHWIYDGFAVDAENKPDLDQNIGGVPLGLRIAEDIFNEGRALGLKKSPVPPRP